MRVGRRVAELGLKAGRSGSGRVCGVELCAWPKTAFDSTRIGAFLSTEAASTPVDATPAYTIEDAGGEVGEGGLRRAWYRRKRVRGSYKKLLPLARQIRGMSVVEAMAQLTFSPKKRAEELRYALYRAATKAEFFHEMDPADLMVEEVLLEKGPMRRFHMRYHSRGRFGVNKIWDTRVKVVVREMTPEEKDKLLHYPLHRRAKKREDLDERWY